MPPQPTANTTPKTHSGSSPYTVRNRPPRKKACLNCTTAKVRCGLEKPSCDRCQFYERECVYQNQNPRDESYSSTRLSRPSVRGPKLLSTFGPRTPATEQSHNASSTRDSDSTWGTEPPPPQTNPDPPENDQNNTNAPTQPPIPLPLSNENDISGIRDRWMRSYLASDPSLEIPKIYNPFTIQYMGSVLRTYPRYMLKDKGLPPIIHHSQIQGEMPRALANCFSLVRMWENAVRGSEEMVRSVVEGEMGRLMNLNLETLTDTDLLATFQSYLLYTILLYFSNPSTIDDRVPIYLMDLASLNASRGLKLPSEEIFTLPDYSSWVIVAARRRTLFTTYLFLSIFNADRQLPNFVALEIKGTLLPEGKAVWESNRATWEREYGDYLNAWKGDGWLVISELWRSEQTGSVARRERVERWLRGVDEFGMMLFAVCAHIHGC